MQSLLTTAEVNVVDEVGVIVEIVVEVVIEVVVEECAATIDDEDGFVMEIVVPTVDETGTTFLGVDNASD
jgi:hypothetical protein